jgi:hypothetical protein
VISTLSLSNKQKIHHNIIKTSYMKMVPEIPEAPCETKLTRGEKEEPLVTSVANPTSTLD